MPKPAAPTSTEQGSAAPAIRRPATWRVSRREFPIRSTCSSASCFPRCGVAAKQVEVTVTPASSRRSPARSCASTTSTCRCATRRASIARSTAAPGVKVEVRDPLAAHHELLDRYTDADMHNVTAYLETTRNEDAAKFPTLVFAFADAAVRLARSTAQGTLDSGGSAASRRPIPGRCTTATTPAAASARSRRSTRRTSTSLTLAWVYRPNAGQRAGGRRRPDGRHDQGHAGRRQRRAVRHDSRSRLGRRRAHRPRDLAFHVAVERRLAHRQSRRRGARATRSTSKRPTAISSRSTSAMDARSGAPRSAISSSSTTPRWRR